MALFIQTIEIEIEIEIGKRERDKNQCGFSFFAVDSELLVLTFYSDSMIT